MLRRQVLLHNLQQCLPILDVCQIVTQYEREFQCEADHFTFRIMRNVTCLAAVSADVVAFGFQSNHLGVWNIETGIRLWSTEHHRSEIRAIKRLSSKGFIAWSLDGHICVWGINGVDCIFEVQLDVAAGFVKEVAAICANSKLLVAFEHLVYVFDIRTAQNHSFEAHDKPITGLVVLSDDCKYVTCADDGFVRLWQFVCGNSPCLCEIPAEYPRALTALDHGLFAFKYDSSRSIAVHESFYPSADRSFYNCNEGERVNVLAKLSEWKVAIAMHNGRVFEWDIFTGKKREFPDVSKEPITSMFMFDDGKRIVAFTNNGFQIWDAKTLKLAFTCTENVSSMVGLSSCKLVASCWREGVIVFY